MKAYLDKDKVLQTLLSSPEKKSEFLLAKFHEGERVPNKDSTFYDTTWMFDLDGLEVNIEGLNLKIVRGSNITIITQPYKDAWITWR